MKRLEFHDEGSWHERGYLPHYDAANYYQMITYRLADSLPQKILNELNLSAGSAELNSASSEYKILKRKLIEKHLDQAYGSCCLREPDAAKIVVEAWQYFDGIRYDLVAYVVMPNHVHVLIKTYASFALSKVIQSWKTFTAREIRRTLKKSYSSSQYPIISSSTFWQREYWDRFIRDEKHFYSAIQYIHENPVKAGLCKVPRDWSWSSSI